MTKLLRVRVMEDGHQAVNVKIPIGVAKWGMKMAQAMVAYEGLRGHLVTWPVNCDNAIPA